LEIVSIALLPLSKLYGAIVWLRNRCYDMQLFHSRKVDVPVISVGNMTAGGTGKTPFVEYLVRYLLARKKRVAVISRGYKRKSRGLVVVSDGGSMLVNRSDAGDEPFQIAEKFPEAVVIVDERRLRAARESVEKYGVEVIVLDDGFQHRSLERDLDVVMVNGAESLQDLPMLPAGLRREPMQELGRADLVVISGPRSRDDVPAQLKKYTSAPVVSAAARPILFRSLLEKSRRTLEEMRGSSCMAFCGIGNPESFRRALESAGVRINQFVTFRDHHGYTAKDLEGIMKLYEGNPQQYLVTTEKDAVKLRSLSLDAARCGGKFCFLEIEMEIVEGRALLHESIDAVFRRAS